MATNRREIKNEVFPGRACVPPDGNWSKPQDIEEFLNMSKEFFSASDFEVLLGLDPDKMRLHDMEYNRNLCIAAKANAKAAPLLQAIDLMREELLRIKLALYRAPCQTCDIGDETGECTCCDYEFDRPGNELKVSEALSRVSEILGEGKCR